MWIHNPFDESWRVLRDICHNRQIWLLPLALVVVLRLAFGILSVVGWYTYPQGPFPPFYAHTSLPFPFLWDRLFDVWARFDTGWYISIAKRGYGVDPTNFAFLPLYPTLLGALARLLGGAYLFAGLAISTLATWLSFVLLLELVRREAGEPVARKSTLYLAIFPTAFYLFAAYTESLFLALTLGSFLAARHLRRWWLAGFLAGLAALTRSLGVFLMFPLACEWWSCHRPSHSPASPGPVLWLRWLKRFVRPSMLSIALPALALGGWMFWAAYHWNVPLTASIDAQAYWARSSRWPWRTIIRALKVLFVRGPYGIPLLQIDWHRAQALFEVQFLLFGAAALMFGMWSWRRGRLPSSYLIFLAIGLALPLTAPTPAFPLFSYPRFLLVLFPIHILAAQLGVRSRTFHWAYSLTSGAALALLFIRWANSFWVA